MFGKRTRAEESVGSQQSTREHDRMYKKWYEWLRSAKQRNIASAESERRTNEYSNQGGCGSQGAIIGHTAPKV